MQLHSTNRKSQRASFRDALFRGQPDDRGLYMPTRIPQLSWNDLERWRGFSYSELAFEISRLWIGDEIEENILREVVSVYEWEVPLREVETGVRVLELWHGPTLAFKDFAAQWMGRMIGALNRDRELTVLVATSGDTGSAVAAGFYGQRGIRVVLLYPSGRISRVQEQQLTTFGGNVTAVEVEGTFDDCQCMVKQAFADEALRPDLNLTSANSINIGRLLPQSIYYVWAYLQCDPLTRQEVVISVPSGNLGNLTAGVLAKFMGLPVRFLAASNMNDEFPEFLASGKFSPRPSIPTISNAMDVGNPSNIVRLFDLYARSVANNLEPKPPADPAHVELDTMRRDLWSTSVDDATTRLALRRVFDEHGVVLDPHTAVAWEAMERYRANRDDDPTFVIVGTAHPAKFIATMEEVLGEGSIEIPTQLAAALSKRKESIVISTRYEKLKELLQRR